MSGQLYAPSYVLTGTTPAPFWVDTTAVLEVSELRKNPFFLSGFEPRVVKTAAQWLHLTAPLRLPLPSSLTLLSSSIKILYAFLVFLLTLHLPPWFDRLNNVRLGIELISSLSRHFS